MKRKEYWVQGFCIIQFVTLGALIPQLSFYIHMGGFPKMMGVRKIGIIVYWGLYWGLII